MQKAKENSSLKDILIGSVAASLAFILISLAMSAVLLKTGAQQSTYLPLLMTVSFVSGLTGGYAAVRKKRKNGLVNGLLASLIPLIFILLLITVANKGFNIFELVICVCCLFGSCLGSVLTVNIKRKRKIKKKH